MCGNKERSSLIFLSAADVAEQLGIGYDAALAFIKYSGIDYVKIGRQYRVEEGKFRAFLMKKGSVIVDINDVS